MFVVISSFGCAIGIFSDIATKAAMAFPKTFVIFQLGHIRPSYFQTNVLSRISFASYHGYGFTKYLNMQLISIRKTSLFYNIDTTASPPEPNQSPYSKRHLDQAGKSGRLF